MNETVVKIFFTLAGLLVCVAYTILIASSVSESSSADVMALTEKVQEQFWEIQDLKTDLSVCNYELGNTQTIELNAVVYNGMVR